MDKFRGAMELSMKSLGPASPTIINFQVQMAWVALLQGHFDESEASFQFLRVRLSRTASNHQPERSPLGHNEWAQIFLKNDKTCLDI